MASLPVLKYGKKIDNYKLKGKLNKKESIFLAKQASETITSGTALSCCPVCNSTNFEFLQTIYGFSYYNCCSCNVAFVANPPSDKEISKIYNSDYYSSANKVLLADVADYRVINIAEPKVEYIIKNITTTKKTWLDIGCGIAEILHVASRYGFKVLGLETNEEARKFGVENFGVDIVDTYITKDNFHEFYGMWGVISLLGVLEHIKDPSSLIASISPTQKKNDNLIIEVPHFPSISAYSQISFPEMVNRIMHPPLHLFLFSIKSLEYILNKNNYEITHTWYFGQDFYEVFSTLGLLAEDLENSLLQEKMSMLISDFQQIIDNNKLSDEVLLIARKNM